jgi:hypothetical protein
MINSKPTADLDEVLGLYARASEAFDAKVLRDFIEKYPEHAKQLQRYAQVQLTFKQPTRAEVEAEPLTDEEMLPQRSKLLQRMQQLRGTPSPDEVANAAKKLAAVSGASGVEGVARAIFSSAEHGEDLLFLSVVDSTSPVDGVPDWFYEGLGSHLGSPAAHVVQAIVAKRQQHLGHQRFSAQDKLAEGPPVTWEQLVEDCITDEEVKKKILERTERS